MAKSKTHRRADNESEDFCAFLKCKSMENMGPAMNGFRVYFHAHDNSKHGVFARAKELLYGCHKYELQL